MTKCTNIYPSYLGLCHTYVFYDQFMNKTHVEGVQNICSFPYCYPFKLKIVVKRQMIIIYEKYSTSSNWYFSMTFTDFPRQNVFFQANITSMTFQCKVEIPWLFKACACEPCLTPRDIHILWCIGSIFCVKFQRAPFEISHKTLHRKVCISLAFIFVCDLRYLRIDAVPRYCSNIK